MGFPVYLPFDYASRYSLLGVMACQLAQAFARRGCEVNPPGPIGERPSLLVYFNFMPDTHDLFSEVIRPDSRMAIAHFMVDHPLALNERQMGQMVALPNYRLLLPCADGAHLLRLRWPGLVHAHCLHGVAPEALCDADSIESSHARESADEGGRPLDLVVMGSIHSEGEIERLRGALPDAVRRPADELIELLTAEPLIPFEQALDLTVGLANIPTGQWGLAALVWRYATAAVNRRRRIALVRAMQGVRTHVYGGEEWSELCTGTIQYHGPIAYADVPGVLRLGKVSLAWGPTQFTHSFSERLLLCLASGCATVADDRLLVRRHFAASDLVVGSEPDDASLVVFPGGEPAGAREAVERLLGDADARGRLATRARASVERGHLWEHRLDLFASVGSHALAA